MASLNMTDSVLKDLLRPSIQHQNRKKHQYIAYIDECQMNMMLDGTHGKAEFFSYIGIAHILYPAHYKDLLSHSGIFFTAIIASSLISLAYILSLMTSPVSTSILSHPGLLAAYLSFTDLRLMKSKTRFLVIVNM